MEGKDRIRVMQLQARASEAAKHMGAIHEGLPKDCGPENAENMREYMCVVLALQLTPSCMEALGNGHTEPWASTPIHQWAGGLSSGASASLAHARPRTADCEVPGKVATSTTNLGSLFYLETSSWTLAIGCRVLYL